MMVLELQYDDPSSSEVNLKDMDQTNRYQFTTKHNIALTLSVREPS